MCLLTRLYDNCQNSLLAHIHVYMYMYVQCMYVYSIIMVILYQIPKLKFANIFEKVIGIELPNLTVTNILAIR